MHNRLLTHFGFTAMPFAKNLRVEHIFPSVMLQSLLSMFEIGLATEDLILACGEAGCGKSVALRRFIESLDGNQYCPVYLKSNRMHAAHLYQAILAGLKVAPPFRAQAAKMLYEKVVMELRKKPVIILDDAQDLADDALREIKDLVSFEADSRNRICVILAGQTEIAEKLKFALFTPIRQRIRLQYHAGGMDLAETCQYIQHNLTVCGKATALFTDDAKAEIFTRTNGLPRLVNKECYRAIIAAAAQGKVLIEPSLLPPNAV